jgi:rhodanese-related sulfurtransferase
VPSPLHALIRQAGLAAALTLYAVTAADDGHPLPGPSVALVQSDHVAGLLERQEPVFVVDLRTPAEFAAGHIPGAVSVPLAAFEDRLREIPRTRRVLLYCHCPLEAMAGVYQLLFRLGYRNHAVLADGYAGWTARGLPVVR